MMLSIRNLRRSWVRSSTKSMSTVGSKLRADLPAAQDNHALSRAAMAVTTGGARGVQCPAQPRRRAGEHRVGNRGLQDQLGVEVGALLAAAEEMRVVHQAAEFQ